MGRSFRTSPCVLPPIALLASVLALLAPLPLTSSWTFFVDSRSGDDARSGRSTADSWRSLARARQQALVGGDSLLFARGAEFAASSSGSVATRRAAPSRTAVPSATSACRLRYSSARSALRRETGWTEVVGSGRRILLCWRCRLSESAITRRTSATWSRGAAVSQTTRSATRWGEKCGPQPT